MTTGAPFQSFAPGRVNLMGDHTDYTGGLVLPVAVQLGTTLEGTLGGDEVVVRSAWAAEDARIPLDVEDAGTVEPRWARYAAGVVAELAPPAGLRATVTSTLPVGAGLSSSAALEVALALALAPPDLRADHLALAAACRRAEERASGVPCGIMDQLAAVSGQAGCALRIDCRTIEATPIPLPEDVELVVVDTGERRALAGSAYADRVAACRRAEAAIGPLRDAALEDVSTVPDPVDRRRARHVVTENARVEATAHALAAGDLGALGPLFAASHASLRDDYEVSTPHLDEVVAALAAAPGVHGARLTGAGFGGCAVAVVARGASLPEGLRAWRVEPSDGARFTSGRGGRPSSPGTPRR